MKKTSLAVGSRGSQLALAQSKLVIQLLRSKMKPGADVNFTVEVIKTSGDEFGRMMPPDLSGKDAFTRELDDALRRKEIDLAVHSLKDVPVSDENDGVEIGAYPLRESPLDALVSRTRHESLESLPTGSKIGTSSVRRQLQLQNLRPDLKIFEIHGNVPTRIKKLRSGDGALDALVLAEAGLRRLNLLEEIDQVLSKEAMLPAPGQGCLAVAVRSEDLDTKEFVKSIDDENTRLCVRSERSFSREFGGGCNVPIAALALVDEGNITLEGLVGSTLETGKQEYVHPLSLQRAKMTARWDKADDLGRQLAQELKNKQKNGLNLGI